MRRLKRNGGNPPRAQHGFVTIRAVRCPACEDRGALRNDGGARVLGGQLRGFTKDLGITTASAGCEVCKGRGWLQPTDKEARDPYSRPLSADQAARLAKGRRK